MMRRWTRRRFSLKLIEESDLGFWLHYALHNLHIEPGVLMGFRTRNDAITDGERAFILASIKKAFMEGYTPIKLQHFNNGKKKE